MLTLHAAVPQDNGKEQQTAKGGFAVYSGRLGAAGRGDRRLNGALCPTVNLVPGACADIIGGAHRRVPVWETASLAHPPALAASCVSPRFLLCGGRHDTTYSEESPSTDIIIVSFGHKDDDPPLPERWPRGRRV